MLIEEDLVIDLTRMRTIAGKLIPNNLLELRLIELFRLYYTDENEPIVLFTKEVLKVIYNDDVDRPYDEIVNFYREREYVSIVFGFLNTLEHILLNSTTPNIVNMTFKGYISNTETKLEVVFNLIKYEADDEKA
jgi:hypothetical protein